MSETRRYTSTQGTITVEIDGQVFEGHALTVDMAEPIFQAARSSAGKGNLSRALTAATFGLDESSLSKMPWAIYSKLTELQVEINGLKPVEEAGPEVGEKQAASA